jgi:SAM-dependent methyltransferase
MPPSGDAARIAANREHWDARADVHARSRYYDLAGVRARGPAPIVGPDEAEVGPVAGKRLLHLQCHIGTDTLRWAALGATVTGVDLSPGSLAVARSLAADAGLAARFIEADIDDLPDVLDERFDVVYASYGVLCWVPDLPRWAAVAAAFVAPDGFAYLADGHPFDVAVDPGRFGRSGYFDRGPRRFEVDHSYVEATAPPITRPVGWQWFHPLGDVVNAFAATGLHVDFLHEHPHPARPDDAETGVLDRRRAVPPGAPGLFSLKASRR